MRRATTAAAPADLARGLQRPADLDPLLERIGDARWVLLGEASHGTHEYYRWRAALTRRLVAERGFTIVAVEGDWPACAQVDAWVRGLVADARDVEDVLLGAFERWPTWMWANREMAELVGQLVRERHAAEGVVAVGFGCHRGSVIAGEGWGSPLARMRVPSGRDGSLEDLLHRDLGDDALLVLPTEPTGGWAHRWLPHRAIGVVYDPEREHWANYVPTVPAERYDAFLWLEQTAALRPLGVEVPAAEELETYPFGR